MNGHALLMNKTCYEEMAVNNVMQTMWLIL